MTVSLNLTQSLTLQALGEFVLSVLPSFVMAQVVIGEENQVAEPNFSDYVVMTPVTRRRTAYNVDFYQPLSGTKTAEQSIALTIQIDVHGPNSADNSDVLSTLLRDPYAVTFFQPPPARLTASVAADVLTVTGNSSGAVFLGGALADATGNLAAGTAVTGFGTGTGGLGTYLVAPSQAVPSEAMTLYIPYVLAPLYAESPVQTPFLNGEQQVEYRWSIDVVFQAKPVVTIPQDFATSVAIDAIDATAVYAP